VQTGSFIYYLFSYLLRKELGMGSRPIKYVSPDVPDEDIPTITVRLSSPSVHKRKRFIHISEELFTRLSPLPGKCVVIFLILLQHSLMERQKVIKLTSNYLTRFGITRGQKERALRCLEKHGFIRVKRCNGRNPVVTLLRVDGCQND
jgi:hypothetical protein